MPSLIPVAILRVSFVIRSPTAVIGGPDANLQNVALQLPANAPNPEDHLRCREVLSRSYLRLSRPTPSAFLAWLQLENRLLSDSSMHR